MLSLADLLFVSFFLCQHNSELFSAIYLSECNFANGSPVVCVR